jgi:hypothetical protein
VAHTCNPSNSGGRHQEDRVLRPVQVNSSQDPINSSQDPILKIPNTKRAGGVPQVVEHLPSKC